MSQLPGVPALDDQFDAADQYRLRAATLLYEQDEQERDQYRQRAANMLRQADPDAWRDEELRRLAREDALDLPGGDPSEGLRFIQSGQAARNASAGLRQTFSGYDDAEIEEEYTRRMMDYRNATRFLQSPAETMGEIEDLYPTTRDRDEFMRALNDVSADRRYRALAPAPDRTFLEEVGVQLKRGASDVVDSAKGFALDTLYLGGESAQQSQRFHGDLRAEEEKRDPAGLGPRREGDSTIARGVLQAARSTPQAAVGAGAALATGPIGSGIFFASQIIPQRQTEYRRLGFTDDQARFGAIVSGSIEGAIEQFLSPLEAVVPKGVLNGALREASKGTADYLRKAVMQYGVNVAKEFSEEIAQDATNYVSRGVLDYLNGQVNLTDEQRRYLSEAIASLPETAVATATLLAPGATAATAIGGVRGEAQAEQARTAVADARGKAASDLREARAEQQAQAAEIMDEQFLREFAESNKEAARELASKPTPSRRDIETLLGRDVRTVEQQRAQISQTLREILSGSEVTAKENVTDASQEQSQGREAAEGESAEGVQPAQDQSAEQEVVLATEPESVSPQAKQSPPNEKGGVSPTSSTPESGVQSAAAEEPWHLKSIYEVREAIRDAKETDDQLLKRVFGEEGAKRFNRLDRQRNSTDTEKAAAAAAQFEAMVARLTPEQQNKVYGVGETGPTLDELKELESALSDVQAKTLDDLAEGLMYRITDLPKSTDGWTWKETVAVAAVNEAGKVVDKLKIDRNALSAATLRRAAARFPGNEEYMLGRFLTRQAPVRASSATPSRKQLPAAEEPFDLQKQMAIDSGVSEEAFAGTVGMPSNQRGPLQQTASPDVRPIDVREVVAQVEQIARTRIRTGRGYFAQKRVAGWYAFPEHVIRSEIANDLNTYVHEMGHALHGWFLDNNAKFPPAVRTELTRLGTALYGSRAPSGGYAREGFAEFIARVAWGEDAAKLAPHTAAWFNGLLDRTPSLRKDLDALRSMLDRWQRSGALGRATGSMATSRHPFKRTDQPLGAWAAENGGHLWKSLYANMIDRFNDFKKVDQLRVEQGKIDEEGDRVYDVVTAILSAGPTMAQHAILDGVVDASEAGFMRTIGKSFQDHVRESGVTPQQIKQARLYAWARHAREAWGRGINPGLSKEDADTIYAKLHSPSFEKFAIGVTEFNNDLVRMSALSGVITDEERDAMIDAWQTYLPLMRVKHNSPLATHAISFNPEALTDPKKVFHRRKGSGEVVLDPLLATMERANTLYQRALQQQATIKLVQAIRGTSFAGALIREVPPSMMIAAQPSVGEAAQLLEDVGVTVDTSALSAKDLGALLEIWRPNYRTFAGHEIQRVMIDGKPVLLEFVDPELLRAVQALQPEALPLFLQLTLGAGADLFKLGATGLNVAFAAANIPRDFLSFIRNTRRSLLDPRTLFAPAYWTGAYIAHKLGATSPMRRFLPSVSTWSQSPTVALWEELHGNIATRTGFLAGSSSSQLLRRATGQSNLRRIPGALLELVRSVVNVSEVGPRIAEFSGAMKEDGWDDSRIRRSGPPPRKTLVKATNAGRDVTTNFNRSGFVGRKLNKITINYLNACIQSLDKHARAYRESPGRTIVRDAVLISAMVLYTLKSREEDWYKRAEAWLKYGFWVIPDENGAPKYRIPLPYEWGWLTAAPISAAINAYLDGNPGEFGKYAEQAARKSIPGVELPFFTPAIEAYFNWDSFRAQPIIKESLERMLPERQYTPYTTETAKNIGKMLGVSPARLEHFLNGLTGGGYRMVARPAERLWAGKAPYETSAEFPFTKQFSFRRDYTESVDELYDKFDLLDKQYNTARVDGKLTPEMRLEHKRTKQSLDLLGELRKLVPQDLADRDERFKVEKYYEGRAGAALDKEPVARYPDPIADDASPPAVQAVRDTFLAGQVDALTDPRPERGKREPDDEYMARVEMWHINRQLADEWLDTSGLPIHRLEALLRKRVREKGDNTSTHTDSGDRSAFGDRMLRLRASRQIQVP